MLVSGWKSVSMIDVHGKVTFTLWLCGCNLKCPFCHNWKIAENIGCVRLDEAKFFEDLEESKFLIDYLHITGGEPLLQWKELKNLLRRVKELGIAVSLNTNGTLIVPLKKLIREGLIDHMATDLKAPPSSLYGLSEEASGELWKSFLKSLDLISKHQIPLELRIPVARGFAMDEVLKYIDSALSHLNRHPNFYIILNPLVGAPMVSPRDGEWCRVHCFPKEELEVISEHLEDEGISPVLLSALTEKFLNYPKG
ncbi:MAG: anaerobic ribonucleoside-triphosphate reductase activating protein [Palaeococcus sp.]|uniref:anaerobic ribonucleoside-triphosphate reductase activating protein n=1 Tax=Palaeococcus sp. (in: euryarchaeotes) TaxID=2820298 RepID=UPI0025FF0C3A|nr:anaerobic ribonucleoside-triphosphate reductase activating protein [Palaeococcus sp. (in: euryarchaeotes)]MCD6559070.1 anaerobic ribonucleoside-triphosphate reductase activating protein [Palaeococcus sp. (in: euryarchaeotes)]